MKFVHLTLCDDRQDIDKNAIFEAQCIVRDARRGKGRFTLEDYEWTIDELAKVLKAYKVEEAEE